MKKYFESGSSDVIKCTRTHTHREREMHSSGYEHSHCCACGSGSWRNLMASFLLLVITTATAFLLVAKSISLSFRRIFRSCNESEIPLTIPYVRQVIHRRAPCEQRAVIIDNYE